MFDSWWCNMIHVGAQAGSETYQKALPRDEADESTRNVKEVVKLFRVC